MRPTRIPVAVEFEKSPSTAAGWTHAGSFRGSSSVDADPDAADEHAVERIDPAGALERWRYPGQLTEMHPSEGEGYWLNLNSPDPRAFVMWRVREGDGEPPVFPVVVTLSYNQAARMMDGGEQVDSVPLDPRIHAMLVPTRRSTTSRKCARSTSATIMSKQGAVRARPRARRRCRTE
jgi:hypothetical protein